MSIRHTEFITKSINHKDSTIAVFLDIEKAYDATWHDGLLFKMDKFNFPPAITKVISSYLQDRTFHVREDGTVSSPREMTTGVPQGSVISPTLYNIFTADIPKMPQVELAIYADDIANYSQGRSL